MRFETFRSKGVMLCVVAMLAGHAFAAVQDDPRAEVFGGYQYTRVGAAPGLGANGWNGAITGYLTPWFGVTGDLSGASHSVGGVGLHANTFTFGPSLALRGKRVTWFGHVLVGRFRGSTGDGPLNVSLSGAATLAGGGVDVRATNRISARLFQLDWIVWSSQGLTEKKNARISGGVVFRIR